MKKIFITGESGVIPIEICRLAPMFGCVVVNTNLEPTLYDYLKKFKAFDIRKPEIDFTDYATIRAAIELLKPDVIIHSGAFVGTDYCDSRKDMATIVNVYGTQTIVDLCNEFGIPLVYFSTTAIFDPKDYSATKPINERTNINPQTLYGITKYAGELIVNNTAKIETMVVRPVFGFGDYPNDLHSALTKLIYTMFAKKDNNLTLKLNSRIAKNYFRVENIAYCVLKLITKDIWNICVNVGENYTERKNWYELNDIIISSTRQLFLHPKDSYFNNLSSDRENEIINYAVECFDNNIFFESTQDYLHWHNIDNSVLTTFIGREIYIKSLMQGIQSTIKSVVENKDIQPYWL